ncbi:DNA/RNA polymerase [Panus rudis PR-1116 ss-1]|nr:DNA/RNA polymerase [Panus rudis PR-1116 ss-1]
MHNFLQSRLPYTVLPPLLSDGMHSPTDEPLLIGSQALTTASIIDACLHNLHDVPRAKQIFDSLRRSKENTGIMETRLYNAFLNAYIEVALNKDPGRRSHWVEDACALFEAMEEGREGVAPNANTYAIMLRAWARFKSGEQQMLASTVEMPTPQRLLRGMVDRQIPVSMVISDRAISNSEEAAEVIKLLSKAAVEMNLSKVVSELGMSETLGRQLPDPLDDVPEIIPVMKAKQKRPEVDVTYSEDGTVKNVDMKDASQEPELEVPFNLANLRKHLAQVVLARRVLPEDVAARQKLLEESVYDVAVERLRKEAEVFDELGLGSKGLGHADLRKWLWEWHLKLQARLKAEIANLAAEEAKLPAIDKNLHRLTPFLTVLKPEKLSLITILEVMHLHNSDGLQNAMKTARAVISVGKAVELEHKAEICRKNNIAMPTNTARAGDHGYFTNLGYRDLHARRVAARKYMEDAEEWTAEWSQVVRVKVGSFLLDALMDVATVVRYAVDKTTGEQISEVQPAFVHSYEYVRGQKLGIVQLNSLVAERIAKDSVKETLHPRHLPMLIKPKPWLSHEEGGYLYNKATVMRFKENAEQVIYLREAANKGNCELVFAALDVLGTTPWKINREVFDVVLTVWNSGKRFGKIPPAVYDAPEPEIPDNVSFDPRAKSQFVAKQRAYYADKANNHSRRCNVNYQIEVARTFLGETIYFPHNVDFRGRAYPIPPHLNHLGDDLSRGLLKFGEAKQLGERGLRWLKIHLSNLYGYDKASFDERVRFVEDHIEDIMDSAKDPLNGRGWWQKADDPWQCLAACKELTAALESGDPHNFLSDLPVHQDGTCNGLQHYAALGGDTTGARQVNLDVTDRPSDVYTYVANMVEEQIKKDMEAGEPLARLLSGKIQRKVVKQTVMTTVYGVTYIGAREQIEKQLKDRGDIPLDECWNAAAYLTKVVLGCIGDLFKGAKEIQAWLNLSAKLISKSIPPERIEEVVKRGPAKSSRKKEASGSLSTLNKLRKEQMTAVIWTTPLGLPIVQPYRQIKKKQIITSLQTVYISDPSVPANVNTQKQATAFPPNFIHSLDATHMMLTALECRTRNITFASVHDSYWTHAATVDEMSGIIRVTFIALHSSDVLKRMYEEFKTRYKGYKIPLDAIRTALPKLPHVKHLVEVTPEGNVVRTITESGMATEVPSSSSASASSDATDNSLVANEEAEEEDKPEAEQDEESSGKKRMRTRWSKTVLAKMANAQDARYGQTFVEVEEALPPLPEKGQFDVSTIKRSLYFFS